MVILEWELCLFVLSLMFILILISQSTESIKTNSKTKDKKKLTLLYNNLLLYLGISFGNLHHWPGIIILIFTHFLSYARFLGFFFFIHLGISTQTHPLFIFIEREGMLFGAHPFLRKLHNFKQISLLKKKNSNFLFCCIQPRKKGSFT